MPFYNLKSDITNIVIGQSRNFLNDFNIYAKGYHHIALTSINNLLSETTISDYKFYPCFFLFRQSLELYLKSIIYNTKALRILKEINLKIEALYNNHDLILLSNTAVKILNNLFPDQLDDFCNQLLSISKEFDYIDKSSYVFRYPTNLSGKPATSPLIINASSFRDSMNTLLDQFENVVWGINIETDIITTS